MKTRCTLGAHSSFTLESGRQPWVFTHNGKTREEVASCHPLLSQSQRHANCQQMQFFLPKAFRGECRRGRYETQTCAPLQYSIHLYSCALQAAGQIYLNMCAQDVRCKTITDNNESTILRNPPRFPNPNNCFLFASVDSCSEKKCRTHHWISIFTCI